MVGSENIELEEAEGSRVRRLCEPSYLMTPFPLFWYKLIKMAGRSGASSMDLLFVSDGWQALSIENRNPPNAHCKKNLVCRRTFMTLHEPCVDATRPSVSI